MERLATVEQLVIQQRKEWGEILTGFETKNKYEVSDQDGTFLYYAAEVGGSLLLRLFLKAARPFTVMVVDSESQTIVEIRRPFRFYFHEADIVNADGFKTRLDDAIEDPKNDDAKKLIRAIMPLIKLTVINFFKINSIF